MARIVPKECSLRKIAEKCIWPALPSKIHLKSLSCNRSIVQIVTYLGVLTKYQQNPVHKVALTKSRMYFLLL